MGAFHGFGHRPLTRTGGAVEFQTERLLLRRVQATDAIPLAEMWADRQVTRHMGGPRDFGRSTGWWAVVEKASGHIVGHCGLVEKEVDGCQEIELVYVFAVHSWGRAMPQKPLWLAFERETRRPSGRVMRVYSVHAESR